jgi:methionyl-tRNA synthetase
MFKNIFGSKKFYITTSIAYVNSEPHIGYALESIQADVLARYYRQKGLDVFFQTGTDEHGSKIQRAAEVNHKTSQEFVDELAEKFKGLKEILNLSWDNFIRTTDQKKHWPVVWEIWDKLLKAGDLYKKKYDGYYCVGCESFKTGKDIVDGKCVIHKKELEFIEEENWFFRLSKYTKQIESKIIKNELRIVPESKRNEVLSLLKGGLEDVSFSRSKRSLQWGIPVLNDDTQVMYVWADALTNYISGYGGVDAWKKHPADVHMIGKDISRFHTAIWPGMLISCKLPLPKNIFIHGFVTSNGEKMSKSLNNVIDPYELTRRYGIDPVRYYLLREIPSSEDGDFSYEKFEERYNGDLANGLGNFAARVSTLASREVKISGKISKEVKEKIGEVKKTVEQKMGEFKFNEALAAIWDLIQFGDRYVNENKPWEKSLDMGSRNNIMFNLVLILKEVSILLSAYLPKTSEVILGSIQGGAEVFEVKKIQNLFPRIEKNK